MSREEVRTDRVEDLYMRIEEKRIAWQVPGCAVAVIQGGEVVFSNGFGHTRRDGHQPITPQTLFPIASATKSFTSLSLALLVAEGMLDWDTPLRSYWPDFQLFDPVATASITARDLLCHRSGLPRHDLVWYNTSESREELMKRLRYLEPTQAFRSIYQYQNLMVAAAGSLVEQLSGEKWEAFVKKRILDPLDMENTCFTLEAARQTGRLAHPYRKKAAGIVEVPYLNNEAIGPAGSMISSLEDMTKWLQLHLQNGMANACPLVSSSSLEELYRPQILTGQSTVPYPELTPTYSALGWFTQSYRGHRMIYHAGNLQGFTSLVSFLPEEQMGIVVLSQIDNSRLPTDLSYESYDLLLGMEPSDWHERMKQEARKEEAVQEKHSNRWESLRLSPIKTDDAAQEYIAYTGEYEHPGYGTITISPTDGQLSMKYHDIHFLLEPLVDARFLATFDESYMLQFPLSFQKNRDGEFESLSAPLEPAEGAKELQFTRKRNGFST